MSPREGGRVTFGTGPSDLFANYSLVKLRGTAEFLNLAARFGKMPILALGCSRRD